MKRLMLIAMHFILFCSVNIGGLEAGPVTDEIEVRSGWKELTDQATITVPKKLVDFGIVNFQPGDAVSIEVGYLIPRYDATQNQVINSSYIRKVFTGYVDQVNPKIPVEIQCEDASWLCKRTPINKGWTEAVTFKEILSYVIEETNKAHPDKADITYDSQTLPDISFDKFRIANRNAAQVLQKFKEDPYNLAIYFRDHELKVHLAYFPPVAPGLVEYFLDQNVIDHNLEYRDTDNHKVQVKALILKEDNTYTEQLYGEKGGDQYTLTFTKDESPEMVKILAEAQLKRFAEGYRGNLKSFMIPYAEHGMSARVVDPDFKRDDRYHIDATTLKFGDGIEINVELGIKV